MQVNLTSSVRQTILESLEDSLCNEHLSLINTTQYYVGRPDIFADINRIVEAITSIHSTFALAEFRQRRFPGWKFPTE